MDTNDHTPTENGWDSLPQNLRDDTFLLVMKELSIVKDHNRLLLLVTHGFVEMAIEALIKHHLKNSKKLLDDSRTYPHSAKLLILNELGIISDQLYGVFDWLRKLRNRAAHDALFRLRKQDFPTIKCDDPIDPVDDFYRFCVLLLAGFWNEHLDVFGPLFAPGVTGLKEDGEESAT